MNARGVTRLLLTLLLTACSRSYPGLMAQNQYELPDEAQMNSPYSAFWFNNYGTFRLTESWFWHAEMHFRTNEHEGVPFTGKLSKWYNRHGLKYQFNETFSGTWGAVFRGNFNPDPGNEEFRTVVPEYRLWHEYNFVSPFSRFMAYHRIRIEHRWSRSNAKGSEFIYRNRWRYKFNIKYPINNRSLEPGTFYANPDAEIILQSGKEVIDSPLEDLRLLGALAYIQSPQITYKAGLMYTTGQKLERGFEYRNRWIFRFHIYYNLDWRNDS